MAAKDTFTKTVANTAFDFAKIQLLENHLDKHAQATANGKEQFKNLPLARNRAEHIRWRAIENLDKYLLEFETNCTRNGIKLLWAPEAADALLEIEEIFKKHKITSAVKSKSSVCEEIGLGKHLEAKGFNITETDVADTVIKKTGDTSSHVILPALHKKHQEIVPHFRAQLPEDREQTIEDTVSVIANGTRKKYFEAQAGITGCNFLIADPGSIALTENEGNIIFSSGIPQVHIVLAGIDKIIPSMGDLDTLWPLLATYGTGQRITSYNTIINGPKGAKDTDGPQEVYVVLIDNGRSSLLAKKEQRPALTCIKCGACSNVCPVYKTIGGHAYGIINPGPIGAVTAQHLQPKEGFTHLSGASTLCGKCDQVCPVNIEIHNLLVENRRENAENQKHGLIENYVWKMIIGAMLNRKKMNRGETFKNLIIKSSYKKDWGERREFPELAKKSFNQLWREQHNEK